MKLLKVDTIQEVKAKLDQHFQGLDLEVEMVPLVKARGRYLAEDIYSQTDMPEFRRSVVDGYAVIAKDTFGVSDSTPVFLKLVGTVEMGKPCDIHLNPGETAYIPTGGMLPDSSDSMVMIEFTEKLDETTIAIYKPAAPNAMIMNKGDDFKKGECLYSKGHRVTIKDVGMLAALGMAEIKVFKKPIISIISTGDEVVDISETPKLGQVRDINSYAIAAFAEEAGGEIGEVVRVEDIYNKLTEATSKAILKSNIVLLSGGSSAGNKDMTADVIQAIGKPGVITHGISMKPGKPTIIGIIKELAGEKVQPRLVVGLPGHPMAAILVYDVIVNYFMKKTYFLNQEEPLKISARISENIHAGEGRETYQLVSLKKGENKEGVDDQSSVEWLAEPIYAKSGSISQLMKASGYVKMEALSEGINANQKVEVVLMDR